jgi:carboxylesterase
MGRRWKGILGAGLIVLLLALFWPVRYKPATNARPATSYAEALTRIAALESQEASLALYPGCATQAMTHGDKVARVIVFLHGYRNCPKQFQQLGAIFHELGYNVFIPRMPYHGLADTLSGEHAQLSADALIGHLTAAVDIAQGLGDRVTLVGMSTGGVLAGWAAHSRPDVDRVVLIAPAFGLRDIPGPLTTPATHLFLMLPNFFLWQDSELKANVPNPGQVYPQNSTRALAEVLRLGFAVRAAAGQTPPVVSSILLVTNANDEAVDNRAAAAIAAGWRASGFEALQSYEFGLELRLDHDLIDPTHPKQKVDLVYPVLLELMAEQP